MHKPLVIAPDGTVQVEELLVIFIHRLGRHHHEGASPARLRRVLEHGRETMVISREITASTPYTKKKGIFPVARLEDVRLVRSAHRSSSIHLAPCFFKQS
jgi:hypothetical protein